MKRSLGALIALALSAASACAQTTQTAFTDGLAARQSYETWFNSLQGDYKIGALYWVGQRSKKPPGPCYGGPSPEWIRGCTDAKQRLDPADVRRLTELDYRKGWNSYVQAENASTASASSGYAPSSVERQLTASANADCTLAVVAPPFSGMSWEQASARVTECESTRRRATSQLQELNQRKERDRLQQEASLKQREQELAESSSENYCKDPSFARVAMSAISDLSIFKNRSMDIIDLEHVTTVAFSAENQTATCHMDLVTNSNRRITGLFIMRKNIAGDPLVQWKPD